MITDRFGALLEELGTALNLKLKPDEHGACHIRFPDKIELHLEPNASGEFLNILIDVGSPGEGRYRENVFREALRANGLPQPRLGTFCYGKKTDSLMIHEAIPFEDIHGQKLADVAQSLLTKARLWKDSLARSEVPSYRAGESASSGRSDSIFGIR
jgi:hypothetical protein